MRILSQELFLNANSASFNLYFFIERSVQLKTVLMWIWSCICFSVMINNWPQIASTKRQRESPIQDVKNHRNKKIRVEIPTVSQNLPQYFLVIHNPYHVMCTWIPAEDTSPASAIDVFFIKIHFTSTCIHAVTLISTNAPQHDTEHESISISKPYTCARAGTHRRMHAHTYTSTHAHAHQNMDVCRFVAHPGGVRTMTESRSCRSETERSCAPERRWACSPPPGR